MNKHITVEQVFEMSNKEKRQAFLRAWREWPLLIAVEELKMEAHEAVLPDGNRMTATFFSNDRPAYLRGENNILPRMGMRQGGKPYSPTCFSDSQLIDHLTKLRKKLKELPAEEIEAKYQTKPDLSITKAEASSVIFGRETKELSKDDICNIKNNTLRHEFLKTAGEWPVMIEVPIMNMTVHQVALPDKRAIIATRYQGSFGGSLSMLNPGECYNPVNQNGYYISEHLKTLRKTYLSERRAAKQRSKD